MSTVYFLGAGASKAIDPDLPLATELLPRIVEEWRGRDPDQLAEPRRYIRRFLDANPEPVRTLDFEGLLSFIETALLSGISVGSYCADELKKVRNILVYCLWVVLAQAETGVSDDGILEKSNDLWGLIQQCVGDPTTTVITTNYDLLVECAAFETVPWPNFCEPPPSAPIHYGIPLRYGLSLGGTNNPLNWHAYNPDRTQFSYLKLHGSINWLYCAKCNATDWMGIRALGAAEAFVKEWQCPKCGAEYEPLAIPPAVGKSLQFAPMKRIWVIAVERLAAAERVIFAGFSLNDGDTEIRNLLLLARANSTNLNEVLLIDPASDYVINRYEKIYGELVRPCSEKDRKTYVSRCIPIKVLP